jgi:hypothetical protein
VSRSIGFLPILLSLLLFMTGCLDKKGYIDGEFALDGYTFDVVAPEIEIVESRPGFANNSNVQFKIYTGSNKVNCESLTKFTITTSSSTPSVSSFTDTCTISGVQFKTVSRQHIWESMLISCPNTLILNLSLGCKFFSV